jgi:phage repressor protein C with HTH and peptisase S24 domain
MLRESLLAQGKRKKAAAAPSTHPAASTTEATASTDTLEEAPAAEGISIETVDPTSDE